jgi:colanic acid/amylovoran biosynthesis glycosyltransferase
MKDLYFFSYNYPYSHDFSWKRQELDELKNHFLIKVIPYVGQKKILLSNVPEGIEIFEPLLDHAIGGKWRQGFISILTPRRLFYYREFFRKRVFLKKGWILEWLAEVERIERMLKHPMIKELMQGKEKNKDTILYFYWGLGTAKVIPFLKNAGFKKIIVRFHGFDLYEERKGGYLPFRHDLLKNIDYAVPISEDGKMYLLSHYPALKFKVKVLRLGAIKIGESKPSSDGVLRIISSSNVIPLKRVELIAQALFHLDFKVEWTHLGDGESFENIRKIVMALPANIKTNLPGRITSESVWDFYRSNPIDLFINVSTTEGVPVSIMEAFSFGIPVYATNVGGTSEIVNSNNGKLLDKNITSEDLAKELRKFNECQEEMKFSFRNEALKTYYNKCNFEVLIKELISFLEQ